jgi:precorrin-3B synthase
VSAPLRRGTCPGLTAPMLTGDGLLVRFVPADGIALDAFTALCAAARQHGNGTIEITARGSLQVRGLSSRSAPAFAFAVGALAIAAADGVSVIVDPLADDPLALIDATSVAAVVRGAIADARLALPAKVCVIIDGGGRLHLDGIAADLRLRAIGSKEAPRLHVSLGGDAVSATPLGLIRLNRLTDVVVRLLGVIASQGRIARAADILRNGEGERFRSAIADDLDPAAEHFLTPLPPRVPAEVIGSHPLRDGSLALGIALAFGHAHADVLAQLAHAAGAHGVRAVRLAPGRALLLLGVAREDSAALAAKAERLGFIVRADDPRRRIVACPGAPACASGLIAARALAGEIARHLSPSGDTVHISGCAKGCAHPAAAPLTVVGSERGCGIIRHGTARTAPRTHVDPADIVAEVIGGEMKEATHA